MKQVTQKYKSNISTEELKQDRIQRKSLVQSLDPIESSVFVTQTTMSIPESNEDELDADEDSFDFHTLDNGSMLQENVCSSKVPNLTYPVFRRFVRDPRYRALPPKKRLDPENLALHGDSWIDDTEQEEKEEKPTSVSKDNHLSIDTEIGSVASTETTPRRATTSQLSKNDAQNKGRRMSIIRGKNSADKTTEDSDIMRRRSTSATIAKRGRKNSKLSKKNISGVSSQISIETIDEKEEELN